MLDFTQWVWRIICDVLYGYPGIDQKFNDIGVTESQKKKIAEKLKEECGMQIQWTELNEKFSTIRTIIDFLEMRDK